jgi:hypothetical protein
MPNTEVTDRLEHIEERLTNVEGSSYLHNKRHENDASMLARVLDNLEHHTQNAHGRVSEMRRTASIGAVLATLGAVAELLRRLFL